MHLAILSTVLKIVHSSSQVCEHYTYLLLYYTKHSTLCKQCAYVLNADTANVVHTMSERLRKGLKCV